MNSQLNEHWQVNRYQDLDLVSAVGRKDLVRVCRLLKAGVDPSISGPQYLTPLEMALVCNMVDCDILGALLDAGANPSQESSWMFERTPLFLAITKGHIKAVQLMIRAGADLSIRGSDGDSVLLVAVCSWLLTPELIRLLIDGGADVNAANDYGVTPLHYISTSARSAVIARMLLDAGADPNARSESGMTPLSSSLYYQEGEDATVRALLAAGADFDACMSCKATTRGVSQPVIVNDNHTSPGSCF